jgi:hypothetical protein
LTVVDSGGLTAVVTVFGRAVGVPALITRGVAGGALRPTTRGAAGGALRLITRGATGAAAVLMMRGAAGSATLPGVTGRAGPAASASRPVRLTRPDGSAPDGNEESADQRRSSALRPATSRLACAWWGPAMSSSGSTSSG